MAAKSSQKILFKEISDFTESAGKIETSMTLYDFSEAQRDSAIDHFNTELK